MCDILTKINLCFMLGYKIYIQIYDVAYQIGFM